MRVIAVQAETSLAAALNMMDGWEVVFAHDPSQVAQIAKGAAVLLAGGGTAEGLELIASLRREGLDLPAIVLGDGPPPEGADSTVLTPPFTLDELRSAVEGAIRTAAVSHAVAAETVRSGPASVGNGGSGGPAAQLQRVDPEEPPADHVGRNGSLPDREDAPGQADQPTEEFSSVSDAVEASGEDTQSAALEHSVAEEALPPVAVDAPTPSLPVEPVPVPAALPAPAPEQSVERGWRRRKRRDREEVRVTADTGAPIASRLRAAEDAARAIEAVLTDLPFLADVEMLANGLIGEVVETFSPEVAVLYLPGLDGFWVAGGHQITNAERRLKVKADHPLFRELFSAGEPMLIAPLDLARALVSGVAGARTEALIAGPVYSGSHCVGVIVVGRDDFQDKDLDRLADIATEAAPGLGVAEALDRLRTFRA